MSTAFEIRSPKRHITTNRLWKWLQAGDVELGYHGREETVVRYVTKGFKRTKIVTKEHPVKPVTKKNQIKDSVCMKLKDDSNFVWFYQSNNGRVWHSFERFGQNNPDPIIDFVEAATGGYVICEHDEEFFR